MRRSNRIGFEMLESRVMLSAAPVSAHPAFGSLPKSYEPSALIGPMLSSSAAALSAPANVKATFVTSTNQMQISWSASSGATSYNVYRNTANNTSTAACIGSAVSGTSFVDKSPALGANYFYWVKACKGSTVSPYSTVAQCMDSDRNVSVTKKIDATALLQAINFLQDLSDDINAILKWDPCGKPSVSPKLDSLSASVTETFVETPSGAIVSGTSGTGVVVVNESGEVTAQYTRWYPLYCFYWIRSYGL